MGFVNGKALYGPNMGTLIEIEASAIPAAQTKGSVIITGVIDEEEMGGHGRTVRRKGMAKGSMDNVITVLRRNLGLCPHKYDLHVNFPGGVPIDGPSAGIAIVTALYSAITDLPVDNLVAMTGEISIRGFVRPVGGIVAKLEAARLAGGRRAIIPKENWQDTFAQLGTMEVVPVERIEEVIEHAIASQHRAKLTPLTAGL